MKWFIVAGSQRSSSQSAKVARFVARACESLGVATSTLDLGTTPLPLVEDESSAALGGPWNEIDSELRVSEALVLVSPEWGGMATAALKNFLIGASPEVLGHKPALIVAVTSGTGGVYPVAELRMSSYKNNRVCYVPEHIIVRNVREVLNSFDVPVSDEDAALRTRINYALRLLREYAIALRTVRESSVVDHTLFPFGM